MVLRLRLIPAVAVAAAFGTVVALSPVGPAQASAPGYHTQVLAPVSGSSAYGSSINDRGWVSGTSSVAGGLTHAVLWRDGLTVDLGTAAGQGFSSAVLWPAKNNSGLVVGITETRDPDPNAEPWSCGAFITRRPGYACRGFVWRDGTMRTLPTLGGTHSFATGANASGQVVGWAENQQRDSTCTGDQVLQFRAVQWSADKLTPTQLPPLGVDATSAATAINDSGTVVGISGECGTAVGRLSAQHAVVWRDGQPTRLEDLGGSAWNTPMAVNTQDQVVGFVNRGPADGTAFRVLPALWSSDGQVHQLPLPTGYTYGEALGLNDAGQVVGVAYASTFEVSAAVTWTAGGRVRVLTDPALQLTSANDVDNRGQITGQAHDPASGADVGFIATPDAMP